MFFDEDTEVNGEWIDTVAFENEIEENVNYDWDEHFKYVRFRLAVTTGLREVNFKQEIFMRKVSKLTDKKKNFSFQILIFTEK